MKPEPSSSRKTFNCTHQIWADKRHPYHLSTSSSPPPQLFTLSGPWDLRWFSFNRKFNISSRSSVHTKRDLVNHTVTTSRGMSQIYAARITFDDLDVSPKKKSESSLSFNCLCHPVYSLHSSFGCKLIGSSSSSVYWWQLSFNSMSAFLVLSLTRGDNSIRATPSGQRKKKDDRGHHHLCNKRKNCLQRQTAFPASCRRIHKSGPLRDLFVHFTDDLLFSYSIWWAIAPDWGPSWSNFLMRVVIVRGC